MTVPKYITVNGVRKLNPAWKADALAPPFQNRATALPVVSHPDQKNLFADEKIVVTPSYTQAVDQYQEIVVEGVLVVDEVENTSAGKHGLDELTKLLSRYEVPAGMLSKLLGLSDFEAAEIIVDDSGSMNAQTDARGTYGETQTRWVEAKSRILQMMELIAHVKAPPFSVRFLNRSKVLHLERNQGESPHGFYERVRALVDSEFSNYPNGTTPALERIRDSLGRYKGQSCVRYFMGDGVPNGGEQACRQIEQLLIHRANPVTNPFTFISCTNNDEDTEWMKQCEEIAPYCAEFDDYQDEAREILKDQGKAFPCSFGLYLVAQIVAAFNPHDLDAMDESVPFAKRTLDDLMGYQTTLQEYQYYFDSFLEAQRKQRFQQNYNQRAFVEKLPTLYSKFSTASRAADIIEVSDYRSRSKAAALQKSRQVPYANQGEECCIIL